MDSTTKMMADDIIKRGWYRKSTTLGEGGWPYVHVGIGKNDFGEYRLYGNREDYLEHIETIYVINDDTALKAFGEIYHLDMFDFWEIHEIVTEYRLVNMKKEKE